ncbi:hypothetical protein V8352_13525 [Roseovarius sp. D0-M9]
MVLQEVERKAAPTIQLEAPEEEEVTVLEIAAETAVSAAAEVLPLTIPAVLPLVPEAWGLAVVPVAVLVDAKPATAATVS